MATDTSQGEATRESVNIVGPDAKEYVLAYLQQNIPDFTVTHYTALGSARGTRLIGGVVYHNYMKSGDHNNCEVSFAGEPGWLTKSLLKLYFGYAFVDLDCWRLTALVKKSNKRSRDIVLRLGFKLEGVHPRAMPDGTTGISYGMLRENCKWIEDYGQERSKTPGSFRDSGSSGRRKPRSSDYNGTAQCRQSV